MPPETKRQQPEEPSFRRDLERVLNRHSIENGSDTPDFILAEYVKACVEAFDQAVRVREKWYGRKVGNGISILGYDPIDGPGPCEQSSRAS